MLLGLAVLFQIAAIVLLTLPVVRWGPVVALCCGATLAAMVGGHLHGTADERGRRP